MLRIKNSTKRIKTGDVRHPSETTSHVDDRALPRLRTEAREAAIAQGSKPEEADGRVKMKTSTGTTGGGRVHFFFYQTGFFKVPGIFDP